MYGATTSANLSTLFDIGGIVGAIAAGILSDYSGMSALTCAIMFGFACPAVNMIFLANNNRVNSEMIAKISYKSLNNAVMFFFQSQNIN